MQTIGNPWSPRSGGLCILALGSALVGVLVAGCVDDHFGEVARSAAAADLHCPPVTVTQDGEDWAFRVEGCGQVAYYRCSYQRKTMGRVQCCTLVTGRDEATALLRANRSDDVTTCHDVTGL